MTPIRATKDGAYWPDVAQLVRRSFAYMEPFIGHAPKVMTLKTAEFSRASEAGSVFLILEEERPIACLFTRPSRGFSDALYCGWLAVDPSHRGRGLARVLFQEAQREAKALGLEALTLDTGAPLKDLHQLFKALGFEEVQNTGEVVTFRQTL